MFIISVGDHCDVAFNNKFSWTQAPRKISVSGEDLSKISAQPYTIVKQTCFPNGKNWMHNVVWGRCAEILPVINSGKQM